MINARAHTANNVNSTTVQTITANTRQLTR